MQSVRRMIPHDPADRTEIRDVPVALRARGIRIDERRALERGHAYEIVLPAAGIIHNAETGLGPSHAVMRLGVGEVRVVFLVATDIPHPQLSLLLAHSEEEANHELLPRTV